MLHSRQRLPTSTTLLSIVIIVLVSLLSSPTAQAWAPPSFTNKDSSARSINVSSRSAFLSSAAVAALLVVPSVAVAGSAEDALKKAGTKEDPVFQACLSQCIYDCTKPKGDEQKSRAECRGECKASCATTKQQSGLGNKQ